MVKQSAHLEQVETNAIDDVERLLQEIQGETQAANGSAAGNTNSKDKADDDEYDGNLTRLADKI